MSKRKRSETDDVTADSPRKIRLVDNNIPRTNHTKDAKAKAAARQAKSERRSKRTDKSKRKRPEPAAIPEGVESLIPSTEKSSNPDPFATNDETIPLFEDAVTDAPLTEKSKPHAKRKPKKSAGVTNKDQTSSTNANHRFILFIGNLPYTTTTASVTHHFRALQPFTVRHSTEKTNPMKSKGFAFLEFTSYDRMKTCLKLYHHSLFDPDAHLKPQQSPTTNKAKQEGKESNLGPDVPAAPGEDDTPQWRRAPKDKTRRINVELTAGGGGGKSTARRDKIKIKNAKLAEERERVHKRELEEREKKEREGGAAGAKRGGTGKMGNKGTGANVDAGEGEREGGNKGNVHPSRLQRVRG